MPRNPHATAISARLKEAREKRFPGRGGPARLSEETGIGTGAISEYESGVSLPGAAKLRTLVRALGVTADWILFGAEPAEGVREDKQNYLTDRPMEVILPPGVSRGDRIEIWIVRKGDRE